MNRSHAFMLWSIEDIQSGSPATVQYTRDLSYFDGPCGCASCCPDRPPNIIRQPVATGSRVEEPAPAVEEQPVIGKRKRCGAGKRLRKIRKRESEALDRELEAVDMRLEALDRELKELGSY